MALVTSANNFCNQLAVSFQGDATYRMSTYGFLQGLMNDVNRKPGSGFQMINDQFEKRGKIIGLYDRHYQRSASAALTVAVDGEPDACVAGTGNPEYQQEFSFSNNRYFYKDITLTVEEMRLMCENPTWDEAIRMKIAQGLDAFYKTIDRAMIARFDVIRGKFYDGTTLPKTGSLFDVSGNPVRTLGGLIDVMRREGVEKPDNPTDKLIIVGSDQLSSYYALLKEACCNDKGVNMSMDPSFNNFYFFRDESVSSQIGVANTVLAWEPGQLELVTYNWNRERFDAMKLNDREFANAVRGSVLRTEFLDTTTFDGMPLRLDVTISHLNCTRPNEQYKLTIGGFFDLWALDNEAFEAADDLYEMNFMYRFTAV